LNHRVDLIFLLLVFRFKSHHFKSFYFPSACGSHCVQEAILLMFLYKVSASNKAIKNMFFFKSLLRYFFLMVYQR
jgi:hypothetical protein